jgi:hypothetical protein
LLGGKTKNHTQSINMDMKQYKCRGVAVRSSFTKANGSTSKSIVLLLLLLLLLDAVQCHAEKKKRGHFVHPRRALVLNPRPARPLNFSPSTDL